jgi:ABC-type sugar transport system substrate-binding protein
MRVLYLNPMPYNANPGVDAIGQGLRHRLGESGIELRVITTDFRGEGFAAEQDAAVRAGIEAGVDAIAIYALDPDTPREAALAAREAGIPLFAFARPHYPVNGSVIYPNFNHGVFMAEHLATLVPEGAPVAIIGGPDVVDDIELDMGLNHGAKISGLNVVNDSNDPRYKNDSDVAEKGKAVTLNLLADFPEIVALIPYNDETMHGALEALREHGRVEEVRTVSRNGTPKAVEAVVRGEHDGTWDLDTVGIGAALGALIARQLSDGEALDDEISMSPVGRMITLERAGSWVPPEQRIPYQPFVEGLE